MKIKNETKDFRMGTCTSVRELWRSKSFHTLRNPLRVGGRRELWNFRGEFSNRCSEDKTERIHYRDHCRTALPRREVAHTAVPAAESRGRVLRLSQVQVFDPRERTGVGCHKDTLRGLVRCSWGSLGWGRGISERQEIVNTRKLWLHQRPPKPAKLVGAPPAELDMTAVYDPRGGNISH